MKTHSTSRSSARRIVATLFLAALAACGAATVEPDAANTDAPQITDASDTADSADVAPRDVLDDAPAVVAPDASPSDVAPDALPASWPCPASPSAPCRILPLGDSITVGVGSSAGDGGLAGGYRSLLAARLRDAHLAFEFVGTRADAFGRHEGHTGATLCDALHGFVSVATACPPTHDDGTIEQVLDGAQDAEGHASAPHIVLLMLGANTVRAGNDEEPDPRGRAQAELQQLLVRIHAHVPDALVVVAKITPNYNGTNDAAVTAFNAQIASAIDGAVGSGGATARTHFALVDMFSIFAATYQPQYTSPDQLHPANDGYQRIANAWFDAIAPELRSLGP